MYIEQMMNDQSRNIVKMETAASLEKEVSCGVVSSVSKDPEPCIRSSVRKALAKHHIAPEANDGQETINMTFNQNPDLILNVLGCLTRMGPVLVMQLKQTRQVTCPTMTSIAVSRSRGEKMEYE